MAVRTFLSTVEQAESWGRLGKRTPGLVFEIGTRGLERWRPLTAAELSRVKTSMFFRLCRHGGAHGPVESFGAAPEDRETGADYFRTEGALELRNLEWWMCSRCERLVNVHAQGMGDLCKGCTRLSF